MMTSTSKIELFHKYLELFFWGMINFGVMLFGVMIFAIFGKVLGVAEVFFPYFLGITLIPCTLITLYLYKKKNDFKVRIAKPTLKQIKKSFLLGLGMFLFMILSGIIFEMISNSFGFIDKKDISNSTVSFVESLGFFGFVLVILIAPISEEIFYRGLIGDIFKNRNRIDFIVASSLSFGLLHCDISKDFLMNLQSFLVTFLLGVLLAKIYKEENDNVIIPILTHSFYNTLVSLIVFSNFIKI